jgi:hypothetical protein
MRGVVSRVLSGSAVDTFETQRTIISVSRQRDILTQGEDINNFTVCSELTPTNRRDEQSFPH